MSVGVSHNGYILDLIEERVSTYICCGLFLLQPLVLMFAEVKLCKSLITAQPVIIDISACR